ncbi:MAG: hypothetical protein KF773_15620 [Deltaproteobacteria bacterium]|nr:hypothetical protein [Deltaproteobacteria bacterium]MCW5802651.1 hypothetical protein [Deltaproteobacteria bacterium]
MGRLAVAFVTALAIGASTAQARPASTGWYAEGGLGAVTFLPGADADPGPGLDMRFGRDLFSWLSFGVSVAASSHEATPPPPPVGEWFQLYRGSAHLRLGVMIGRVAAFVEGNAGAAMISSNVLRRQVEPGERFSLLFQAGGGFEYQLENRHYAIGLGVDAFLLPQFESIQALASRLYLRYTY